MVNKLLQLSLECFSNIKVSVDLFNPLTPRGVTRDNMLISWVFLRQDGVIQTLKINHMRSTSKGGIGFQNKVHTKE